MNFINRIKVEWPLRVGLGIMYLYSGQSLIRETEFWYGYAPQWFERLISPLFSIETYLKMQGGLEFLFGLIFLSWFLPRKLVKWTAALGALIILGILVFSGVDQITFRDFGLLGGLVSLFLIKHSEESV